MKTLYSFCGLIAFVAISAQGQFLPGNLAVLRVGDGTQTIGNTGNTIFIDEYSPGGTLASSFMVPDAGVTPLILSGSATAEGFLALSADRRFLTFAAYNTARPYSASVATSPSATVPRAVGMLDYNSVFSIPASSTTAYNLQSWRSSVADGTGNYWGVGSGIGNGGPYYLGNSGPAGMLQTNLTTLRGANVFNGNLYFSHTGSASTGPGIYQFNGLPTSEATATMLFSTGASAGTTDFWISPNGNLAYVADDRSTAAGGIQRWDLISGVWTLSYTLGSGVANIGTRGLAVDDSGLNPVLFATTAETSGNRLITISDTGAASAPTTLATAAANTRFRGLDFVPVIPEPSSVALLGVGLAALMIRRRTA